MGTTKTSEETEVILTPDEKEKLQLTPEQQALFDEKIKEVTRKAAERAEKRVNERAEQKLKEIEEAERLKNMTESEKREAELNAYKEKVAEYERRELVNQFKLELSAAGLPQEYADIVPVENADKAKEAITFFKKYTDELTADKDKRIKELETQLKAAQMRTPAPRTAGGVQKPAQASDAMTKLFNAIKGS